eukprot:TRINITY_DN82216_c0_g2_i1.p1 TRINITY_DN82216_c0_g2~~TRINITY_DN82216_c0_g2_i1.p1  ORF type:complete len:124 (-),score=9.81 TRINITY_DN82216_c0_g2_i1:13-384(-)
MMSSTPFESPAFAERLSSPSCVGGNEFSSWQRQDSPIELLLRRHEKLASRCKKIPSYAPLLLEDFKSPVMVPHEACATSADIRDYPDECPLLDEGGQPAGFGVLRYAAVAAHFICRSIFYGPC